MNVKKKKSKKRYATSSKPQLKIFPLFIDRSLGKNFIATALREAGHIAEIHDDHLDQAAPDEDWIKPVAKKEWVALTKDKNIRYRISEIQSIRGHKARVLVIRAKNKTGPEISELRVNSYKRIQEFTNKTKSPFIAGIDRSGRITKYKIQSQ